jgi:hypothetical protein|tara:strand:- start:5531 stop:5725 length:195 start_codon:yes stop_codon:yes gene_type:complete
MTEALKALNKIDIHEAECTLRYAAIERRLDSGSERFDKLEKMIWGLYSLIISSMLGFIFTITTQ